MYRDKDREGGGERAAFLSYKRCRVAEWSLCLTTNMSSIPDSSTILKVDYLWNGLHLGPRERWAAIWLRVNEVKKVDINRLDVSYFSSHYPVVLPFSYRILTDYYGYLWSWNPHILVFNLIRCRVPDPCRFELLHGSDHQWRETSSQCMESTGRPRRRWEGNIRMDLKEIGINTKNLVDSV